MCTFSRIIVLMIFLFPFTKVNAVSYFGGIGADYMDPRIERNTAGSSSFSTASEQTYQYYVTLGIHMDRRKRHSFRATYNHKEIELETPTNRTFATENIDFDSYNIMYNYSGKSLDMYLDYLHDSALVFSPNQFILGQFDPTPIKSSFAGLGIRFKAYSDKPHNLFSYNKIKRYRDDRGGKVSYNKGFRLVLDFAYYYQLSSDEYLGSEVEYSSKIKAGLKIEKGGTFNYGAKLNFLTEKYDWGVDSYSVLDFGGGIFLKINY